MAVVVNEFEVLPTPEPERLKPPPEARAERPATFVAEEIERELRTRAERAARLEAH
jgi:hypothetical protein